MLATGKLTARWKTTTGRSVTGDCAVSDGLRERERNQEPERVDPQEADKEAVQAFDLPPLNKRTCIIHSISDPDLSGHLW